MNANSAAKWLLFASLVRTWLASVRPALHRYNLIQITPVLVLPERLTTSPKKSVRQPLSAKMHNTSITRTLALIAPPTVTRALIKQESARNVQVATNSSEMKLVPQIVPTRNIAKLTRLALLVPWIVTLAITEVGCAVNVVLAMIS